MPDFNEILVFLAALAAGFINAMAGGGTLLSFPALLAIGIFAGGCQRNQYRGAGSGHHWRNVGAARCFQITIFKAEKIAAGFNFRRIGWRIINSEYQRRCF